MESFDKLVEIVDRLRQPDGCPWDRVQTHDSIKKCLVEETGELLDAIEDNDTEEMKEEIGDVLLQAVFHSQLAKEEKRFDINDVLLAECNKLIYRHPHVFGNKKAADATEALANWEASKAADANLASKRPSVMDGVARSIPALSRAQKALDKASKAQRPWCKDCETLKEILTADMEKLRGLIQGQGEFSREQVSSSIADLLFSLVALARENGFVAEELLQSKIRKYIEDFNIQDGN